MKNVVKSTVAGVVENRVNSRISLVLATMRANLSINSENKRKDPQIYADLRRLFCVFLWKIRRRAGRWAVLEKFYTRTSGSQRDIKLKLFKIGKFLNSEIKILLKICVNLRESADKKNKLARMGLTAGVNMGIILAYSGGLQLKADSLTIDGDFSVLGELRVGSEVDQGCLKIYGSVEHEGQSAMQIRDKNGVTIGYQNQLGGEYSFVNGVAGVVSSGYSLNFGYSNSAMSGVYQFVLGAYNVSEAGNYVLSMGQYNTTESHFAVTMGEWLDTLMEHVYIFGRYNERYPEWEPGSGWVEDAPLFILGNGTGKIEDPVEERFRNAFTVYKNGDVEMTGRVRMPRQGDILMGEFGHP